MQRESNSEQSILFFGSSHIEYSSKHTLEGRIHDLVDKIIKTAREERHRFHDIKLHSSILFHWTHCRFSIVVLDTTVQTQHVTNYL